MDSLDILQQPVAKGLVATHDAFRIPLQTGVPHGDVNPTQHVFPATADPFDHGTDLVAAIGQEGDVLLGREAWLASTSTSRRVGFVS